jgi:WhiB family redox-sensing transcriptional regulator
MPNSRQSRSQSTRRFDQVVCRETAKDFSDESADKEASKQLCMMHCPVKDACLEYALANDERFRNWGGLSPRQRDRLHRRLERHGQPSARREGSPRPTRSPSSTASPSDRNAPKSLLARQDGSAAQVVINNAGVFRSDCHTFSLGIERALASANAVCHTFRRRSVTPQTVSGQVRYTSKVSLSHFSGGSEFRAHETRAGAPPRHQDYHEVRCGCAPSHLCVHRCSEPSREQPWRARTQQSGTQLARPRRGGVGGVQAQVAVMSLGGQVPRPRSRSTGRSALVFGGRVMVLGEACPEVARGEPAPDTVFPMVRRSRSDVLTGRGAEAGSLDTSLSARA